MALTAGTRLGPYEIITPIGAGGMGEVYKARDTRLGRDVAIKILPPQFAGDPAAAARFEREARAVAALSHPNIMAVYDVGTDGAVAFVVTELLDGSTLRERLASGPPSLRRALDMALQIAQGMAAAHAKGIVHRDLKPENVFVTADGFVKILDFGLAKLDDRALLATDATLMKGVATDRGIVLGTVGYLSPEQAEGRAVDHRADIFSFGAVLYELVTGRRAFKADSAIDTLHRIVHDDPPAVQATTADAPRELQWVLGKCLAKDPEERYQSARDLVVDLRNVARLLDSAPNLATVTDATRRRAGRIGLGRVAAIGAVVIVAVALAAVWLVKWRAGRDQSADAAPRLEIERVTASGNVIDAEISPDGKYVAYVVSEGGLQSLWLRQLATGSTLQLVPDATVGYWGISFSRGGDAVYYVQKSGADPSGGLYQIPVIGGTARRLLVGIDSQPVASPDGRRIAYVRSAFPDVGQSALMIANADGSEARALATRRPPEFFSPLFFTAPTWSPDGSTIVCPMDVQGPKPHATLVAMRAADGAEQPFPKHEWRTVGQVAWMPDGDGLIVVASNDPGGTRTRQLWWVDAASDAERVITRDLFDYRKTSVTADARALVTVAADATSSIWVLPVNGAPAEAKRISLGKYDGLSGLAAVAGGRILYRSLESGRPDIWIMDEDGSHRRQITTDGGSSFPAVSPDGAWMAFQTTRAGAAAIWAMRLDGEGARPLERTGASSLPAVSPDGKSVFFTSLRTGIESVFEVSAEGGTPRQVLNGMLTRAAVSPDGRQLAVFWAANVQQTPRPAVVPIDGSAPPRTFAGVMGSYAYLRWTTDGAALLHTAALNDRANVWLQPLDGGAARPVTHFSDLNVLSFDRTADGRRLIVARGALTRDAVLMRNFRSAR